MSEKSKKTIAEKVAELNELVAWFESDDFELEQALTKFKEAETMAKDIEHDLKTVKNDIARIKKDFSKEG